MLEKTNKVRVGLFANIVFGLGILFLISTLAVIMLNFSKYKFQYIFIATVLTLAGIGFFVCVLRLKPNIKTNIALVLFYLVVVLWTIESVLPIDPLIVIKPWDPKIFVDGKFPKFSDRRPKLKVIQDLRKQNIAVYATVQPGFFLAEKKADGKLSEILQIGNKRIFPLSNLSNSRLIFDRERGEWQYFVSDEYGFNNPKGLHNPGQVDIAIIGDSYAQGMGVGPNDNLAGVMRKQFPRTITFGIQGTGPLSQLAIFREYVEPLKPKAVIWVYYEGSDMPDFLWELKYPELSVYLDDPKYRQNLRAIQPQIDEILKLWLKNRELSEFKEAKDKLSKEEWVERVKKTLKLARMRILLGVQFSTKDYVIPCPPRCHFLPPEEPNPKLRMLLAQVQEKVKSWNGKLYFVSIPTRVRVREGVYNHNYDYSSHRDGQLKTVEDLNIPLIDLYPVLLSHPDTMSLYRYRNWGHFNEAGYRFIAESILQTIDQEIKKASR